MASRDWSELFSEVTARVRSLEGGSSATDIRELMHELDLLSVRHVDEKAEALLEAKRKMADLEELHNANRLVTVGTLTVGMAHEFGTPLGVVLARAQMIMSDDQDLVEAQKDAGEIVRQVKRMTQMCREVLDYARPTPPLKIPVDVVALARQMIVLLVPDARKRNSRLVLVSDPSPEFVRGDASKLMQVLTNLIINAAQAMPNGGTVTVTVEKAHVTPPAVEQLPAGEYVCIHIDDVGTGIRSADLGHIFETFFTTKKGNGTGLGLAVSYRIVREHDGWIGVTTEEDKGSRFTVFLPPLRD